MRVISLGRTSRSVAISLARHLMMMAAGRLREGRLVVRFPDGSARTFGDPGALRAARIEILDDEFFTRVLRAGEIGFGEAYMDGLWRSDDIVALLELGIDSRRHVQFGLSWLGTVGRFKDRRLHLRRRNTRSQSKNNIHAHYDLGNEFFRLYLDETMTYSCAVFSSPEQTLADAQRNKYRLICEKAQVSHADHVLEIGAGWGGFAMYAAQNYGCRVTTITISQEQLALARERVAEAGLSSLVDVRFVDYREIAGQYDKIVSIEMFEAVGAEYFETFFRLCDAALRPGGRIAMQVISVPHRSFAALRDGVNWMQKYIFPGGMLPSISEIERALARTSLNIAQIDDIGMHYAPTLRTWRERFLQNTSSVRSLGFDERFIRTWEYYLAACEAGFRTGNTRDLQIVLTKDGG